MPTNSIAGAGEKLNPFLLEKIWRSHYLIDVLCDPAQFEGPRAVAVARAMMERYRNFDTRLVQELMALPEVGSGKDSRIERCLEILDAVSAGRRIIMPLMQLMKSENQRIRSKIARILGSRVDNVAWTRRALGEVDPRTRANIVESLWGNDSREIREIFWQAAEDPNNRVRGNAILGLYRLGLASVLPAIRSLAENEAAGCRATAAWLMGATGDPRFRGMVKKLREDAEASVRGAALRALVQLNKPLAESQVTVDAQIRFSEDLEAVRRIGFELSEGTNPPPGLLATDVVLTENGNLVWEYTLVERRSVPMSVLFLLFDAGAAGPLPEWKDALAECAEQKPASDRWSLARIASGAEGTFDDPASVPPPYQGAELRKAIAQFDQIKRIQADQLSKLVRLVGSHGPGRHVVLCLTPPALADTDLESLEAAATALQFHVDVISFANTGNEKLQRLSRKTAGIFLVAESPVSPAWMVQAYATIGHRYEVTYTPDPSTQSACSITIHAPKSGGPAQPGLLRPISG